MKHPSEFELALFAGGDLGFMDRWRVRQHLRQCDGCRNEVESHQDASQDVRAMVDQMPEGVNWNRLSQEMTGNIRVGLAAGECVGPVPIHRPRSLAWHAAAVISASFAIVVGAMWLNTPRELTHLMSVVKSMQFPTVTTPARSMQDAVVLEASQSSIDLKANGGTMSLLTSPKDGVAVSVSMQGSVRAQYVDDDTGQVTISKVDYAQ